MDKPTPRTDAQRFYAFLNDQGRYVVDADLASELEQTVAKLQSENERICNAHRVLMKQADERAEAAEQTVARLEQRANGLQEMLETQDQEVARLRADAERRDGEWVLAMADALGSNSGYSIPVIPNAQAFKDLFAALKKEPTGG